MRSAVILFVVPYFLLGFGARLGFPEVRQGHTSSRIDQSTLSGLVPDLNEARLVDWEELSEHYKNKLAQEPDSSFVIEGDFNNDGMTEVAIAGVYIPGSNTSPLSRGAPPYRQMGARKGSFVLIASPSNDRLLRQKPFEFEGEEFVIMRRYPGKLAIFFCVGCDSGGYLEWNGVDYTFEPFSPAGAR